MEFKANVLFEISETINGYSYLIIYGKHINGYYCCIPNYKKSCEMAGPTETYYNATKLNSAGFTPEEAKEIAKIIYNTMKKTEHSEKYIVKFYSKNTNKEYEDLKSEVTFDNIINAMEYTKLLCIEKDKDGFHKNYNINIEKKEI